MINHVKVSKEFPSPFGTTWISMGGFTDPGQTPEELLSEIEEKIRERMNVTGAATIQYQEGKMPVIQIGDDQSRDNVLKNLKKQ